MKYQIGQIVKIKNDRPYKHSTSLFQVEIGCSDKVAIIQDVQQDRYLIVMKTYNNNGKPYGWQNGLIAYEDDIIEEIQQGSLISLWFTGNEIEKLARKNIKCVYYRQIIHIESDVDMPKIFKLQEFAEVYKSDLRVVPQLIQENIQTQEQQKHDDLLDAIYDILK